MNFCTERMSCERPSYGWDMLITAASVTPTHKSRNLSFHILHYGLPQHGDTGITPAFPDCMCWVRWITCVFSWAFYLHIWRSQQLSMLSCYFAYGHWAKNTKITWENSWFHWCRHTAPCYRLLQHVCLVKILTPMGSYPSTRLRQIPGGFQYRTSPQNQVH